MICHRLSRLTAFPKCFTWSKNGRKMWVIFNGGSKGIMVDRELGNWKDFIDEMLGN